MHRKHHFKTHSHAADELKVPMYSRASTVGLGVASLLSLLALFLTLVMLSF